MKKNSTLAKIITPCGGQYGAPMGRRSVGFPPSGEKIYNARVPLAGYGDYDAGGAYWGIGKELRVEYTKDLSYIYFYRVEEVFENLHQFVKAFRGHITDDIEDAKEMWFEVVGRMWLRGMEIPAEYQYEPAKKKSRIYACLHENPFYYQIMHTNIWVLAEVAQFLTRYGAMLRRHGRVSEFDESISPVK